MMEYRCREANFFFFFCVLGSLNTLNVLFLALLFVG